MNGDLKEVREIKEIKGKGILVSYLSLSLSSQKIPHVSLQNFIQQQKLL